MRLAWIAAATAALAAVVPAQQRQGAVKVGDVPAYTFSNPLMNGQGVKSLADLQGRPVMVDFWGVH
jgi:hypothetical protein